MAKNLKDVVIVSAVRTPIGKLKGMWAKYQAHELGAKVILNILETTKVSAGLIEDPSQLVEQNYKIMQRLSETGA